MTTPKKESKHYKTASELQFETFEQTITHFTPTKSKKKENDSSINYHFTTKTPKLINSNSIPIKLNKSSSYNKSLPSPKLKQINSDIPSTKSKQTIYKSNIMQPSKTPTVNIIIFYFMF